MSSYPLIVTYHAIESGPPPLCVDAELFRSHLDVLEGWGARTLTIGELADALRRGSVPDRSVCLTFDDGAASVRRSAAPLLAERGFTATVFVVAGHLGGRSDWPTLPSRTPRVTLVDVGEAEELAEAGFEIGSHGLDHAPLDRAVLATARREVVESRQVLQDVLGIPVRSFAWPYAARPSAAADRLIRENYDAACGGFERSAGDPLALPRLDVHYIRDPERLRKVLEGSSRVYLALRRAAARARRVVVKDYLRTSRR